MPFCKKLRIGKNNLDIFFKLLSGILLCVFIKAPFCIDIFSSFDLFEDNDVYVFEGSDSNFFNSIEL